MVSFELGQWTEYNRERDNEMSLFTEVKEFSGSSLHGGIFLCSRSGDTWAACMHKVSIRNSLCVLTLDGRKILMTKRPDWRIA
jgi:hypothetical protein